MLDHEEGQAEENPTSQQLSPTSIQLEPEPPLEKRLRATDSLIWRNASIWRDPFIPDPNTPTTEADLDRRRREIVEAIDSILELIQCPLGAQYFSDPNAIRYHFARLI